MRNSGMKDGDEMELYQSQRQILSPRMMQLMEILQMDLQELHDYTGTLLQENPLLEISDQPEETGAGSAAEDSLDAKMDWPVVSSRPTALQNNAIAGDKPCRAWENVGGAPDSEHDLKQYLMMQFIGLRLDKELSDAIRLIVECLDEKGWLDADIHTIACQAGIPMPVFERALAEVQAAEPAGVGARSLAECLKLQIGRMAGDHHLAETIVESHLTELARGHFSLISKRIGVSRQAVWDACALIRTLDPYPCMGFAASEKPHYITPDICLVERNGRFQAISNHEMLPRLSMSRYYLQLMQETTDQKTRDYLRQKAEQAKWVVQSMEQRQATILNCAQYIADKQEAFLRDNARGLETMTMQELAQKLEIHESTVSRAIRGKYLQGPNGTYPMDFFFSRALGQEKDSVDSAKKMLKNLLENEQTPLSDQKLCEEMRRQGCEIARRTVAKYREELGFPSAMSRRSAM